MWDGMHLKRPFSTRTRPARTTTPSLSPSQVDGRAERGLPGATAEGNVVVATATTVALGQLGRWAEPTSHPAAARWDVHAGGLADGGRGRPTASASKGRRLSAVHGEGRRPEAHGTLWPSRPSPSRRGHHHGHPPVSWTHEPLDRLRARTETPLTRIPLPRRRASGGGEAASHVWDPVVPAALREPGVVTDPQTRHLAVDTTCVLDGGRAVSWSPHEHSDFAPARGCRKGSSGSDRDGNRCGRALGRLRR